MYTLSKEDYEVFVKMENLANMLQVSGNQNISILFNLFNGFQILKQKMLDQEKKNREEPQIQKEK